MSPGAQILEEQKVTKEMAEHIDEQITLPYKVEDVNLISPGRWNGVDWTAEGIEQGLRKTEFEQAEDNEGEIEQNNALFFEHDDRDARAWIGEVKDIRMEGDEMVGDLVIVDEEAARKLEYGAKFGISAKVTGRTDGDEMKNMRYENFSLVLNPAVKTTYINSEMEGMELQDMEIHEPQFEDTADQEWNTPDLEDFGRGDSWDDLSESDRSAIEGHFIVSKTGFPAENFGDLALPVVEPDRTLNLNALANAKARAGQVTGLTGEALKRVESMITQMANDNFEDADFTPVDEDMAGHNPEDDEDMSGHGPEEDEEEMNECNHMSDCAVHRAPAEEPGDCNCGAENDNSNDIMGDNTTMTDEQPESEPEDSPEGGDVSEDAEASVDVESLKEELLEDLKEELQEDEESEEVEEGEGDEEPEEVEEDEESEANLSEFEQFVKEKKSENPELGYKELADMFEEEQKSAEEKVEERVAEVKENMTSQIEDLKDQVTELSESETEPARASQATGQEVQELREKVQDQDREELRKGVMRKMLDQAQASNINR